MVVDLRGAVRFAQHDLPLTHDRHKAGKRRDALHGRKLCLSLCVDTFRISITNAAKTVCLKSPFLSLPLCRLGHLASLATSSPSSSLTLALTVMDGGRRPVNAFTRVSPPNCLTTHSHNHPSRSNPLLLHHLVQPSPIFFSLLLPLGAFTAVCLRFIHDTDTTTTSSPFLYAKGIKRMEHDREMTGVVVSKGWVGLQYTRLVREEATWASFCSLPRESSSVCMCLSASYNYDCVGRLFWYARGCFCLQVLSPNRGPGLLPCTWRSGVHSQSKPGIYSRLS